MSHEDYLEHLGIYYSQKIKILSKNPFYTSCFGMKTEKIFELPLIEIDKELLDSQEIEGSLECCLETKAFDKYISEMMLFGDSMEFVCYKENLFMIIYI